LIKVINLRIKGMGKKSVDGMLVSVPIMHTDWWTLIIVKKSGLLLNTKESEVSPGCV
jgi:hypothetical protein